MTRTLSLTPLLAFLSVACAGPSDGTAVSAVPRSDGFAVVSDMLSAHCGSLDCHGTVARNMRVYGLNGLRLDPAARPDGVPTTPAEYETTYESIVSIEPEILAAVLAESGRRPERLTMIRKERGTESHKGNKVFDQNDDGDRCLVSFVAGSIDTAACQRASRIVRP